MITFGRVMILVSCFRTWLGVLIERIEEIHGTVWIWARPRAQTAVCARCGHTSGRVHSGYERRLADAALAGRARGRAGRLEVVLAGDRTPGNTGCCLLTVPVPGGPFPRTRPGTSGRNPQYGPLNWVNAIGRGRLTRSRGRTTAGAHQARGRRAGGGEGDRSHGARPVRKALGAGGGSVAAGADRRRVPANAADRLPLAFLDLPNVVGP